jgi:hypothetical protein
MFESDYDDDIEIKETVGWRIVVQIEDSREGVITQFCEVFSEVSQRDALEQLRQKLKPSCKKFSLEDLNDMFGRNLN